MLYLPYIMVYAKFTVDQSKAEEIKDFFKAEEIQDEKRPYDYFCIAVNGVQIHAYKNKKEVYTIVFSGEKETVNEEISQFNIPYTFTESKETEKKENSYLSGWEDLGEQIGSDEVGVGDFFGPLIVTAAYVTPKDIVLLKQLQVNDSKKMNDNYILEIGPILKEKIKNYVTMLSASKLSDLYEQKINIHKAMAKAHNFTHQKLIEKYNLSSKTVVYIDQFEAEKNYRSHCEQEIISNPLIFRTKGETYYPSVAAASVISRYVFLTEWKKMEKELNTSIPKGASALVDTIYGRLLNTLGPQKVNLYVKRFFINYKNN